MDKFEKIQKLQQLKENGTLTETEFENEKQKILQENKNTKKSHFGVVLLFIIIGIFALIIGSNIIVSNNAKNMGKNKNYYEQTGAFDSINTNNVFKKYNIDNTEYQIIKKLKSKVESEVKKGNISNADMFYRKSQEDDLGEPYITIRSNNKYITIDINETTTKNGDEKNIVLNQTIAEYYNNIFTKAKNDSNYRSLIYFSNINEFLNNF